MATDTSLDLPFGNHVCGSVSTEIEGWGGVAGGFGRSAEVSSFGLKTGACSVVTGPHARPWPGATAGGSQGSESQVSVMLL